MTDPCTPRRNITHLRIVLAHALYLHAAKKRRGFCTSVLFIIIEMRVIWGGGGGGRASVISWGYSNYVAFIVFDVKRRSKQKVFRVDLSVCLCDGY